jgi:hypothetical protein
MYIMKDKDGTLAADSDARVPTQKAVKTFVTAAVAAIPDPLLYKGVIDCSGSPNYPAADAGHVYKVSVAGLIGGASGLVVQAGDTLVCAVDGTAAGTQAAVGASWGILQTNVDLANPGPIGGTTPGTGAFTTLTFRSPTKTVSTTPVTLTSAEMPNMVVFVTTGASVINLPVGAATLDGAKTRFVDIASVTFSVKPNGSDVMSLVGTSLTGGNKLTSGGNAGTAFEIWWDNAGAKWRVGNVSGAVIDGGA